MDVIFHLASIPGGSGGANCAQAHRVNPGATTDLLERRQAQGVTENTLPRPAMTYSAHKLLGETLVDDFSRRG